LKIFFIKKHVGKYIHFFIEKKKSPYGNPKKELHQTLTIYIQENRKRKEYMSNVKWWDKKRLFDVPRLFTYNSYGKRFTGIVRKQVKKEKRNKYSMPIFVQMQENGWSANNQNFLSLHRSSAHTPPNVSRA